MLRVPRQAAWTALGRARTWVERVWHEVREHPTLQRYRAELERLIGDPGALTAEERRERAWRLINYTATFTQTLPARLLPVVYPPVAMVMVQGIARLHGVRKGARQIALELAGALGGGFLLRVLLRFRPVLLHLGAANAAPLTLALGRFALWYYARRATPDPQRTRERLLEELERSRPALLPPPGRDPTQASAGGTRHPAEG